MLETQTEKDLLEKFDSMEFWPNWLLYLPLIPYIAFQSIRSIRRGCVSSLGFGSIASVNDRIPLGGLIGESKSDILDHLDPKCVLQYLSVPRSRKNPEEVLRRMRENGLNFPVILKPDAGQRGQGVKRIDDETSLRRELENSYVDSIIQEFHPGPFEAGIFYYRLPGERTGRIFSITRKVFPFLIGDGHSSLSTLVDSHPRFRIQKEVFKKRFSSVWNQIPPPGEKIRLAEAGNHCQGTLFLDGSEWITPELEEKIDQISSRFPGFQFGRYDVRFSSLGKFLKGEDLHIVELNGVTSESTNIYDPRFSIQERYAILFRQWGLLFRIARGSTGRRAGFLDIFGAIFRFYRENRGVSRISS